MAVRVIGSITNTQYDSDGTNTFVINNLTNAVQFTAPGLDLNFNKIELSITGEGNWVIISDESKELKLLYTETIYGSAALLIAAILAFQNVPLPAGAATEATLQLVLSAIQGEKDFEANLVRDMGAGGLVVLQIITFNEGTGTFNPPIYFTVGGVPYIPIGPLEYMDTSGILTAILAALGTLTAQESTQLLVKAKTDNLDTLLSTRATEATLALIKAKADNLDVPISTLATEATLMLILGQLNSKLNVTLSTRSSEATQLLIQAKTDNLDVALSTLASQVTMSLLQVTNHTDLTAILAKMIVNPATETTLALLQTTNHADQVAILAKMIVNPATDTLQSAGNTILTAIDNNTKRGATPSVTSVAASITNVTLKASNAARISLIIYNDSTSALYVKYGATATTSSFTEKLPASATFVIRDYTGIIDGLWDTATGNARITEVTA